MTVVRAIEEKLTRALGLRLRRGASESLVRELERLRVERGIDASEVARRIDREPWLLHELAGAVTVEETYFLRHAHHFDLLVADVRARLATATQRITVWSVGCASGEEPYSMAIAIHRALGSAALSRMRILANDISETAIGKAKVGVYGEWSFRGVPSHVREQYFAPYGNREFRVHPDIRAAVSIEHRTIEQQLECLEARSIDVVFFRNVAIYLTEESLAKIYGGFVRVLKHGALLVLGAADPVPTAVKFARVQVVGGLAGVRRDDLPVGVASSIPRGVDLWPRPAIARPVPAVALLLASADGTLPTAAVPDSPTRAALELANRGRVADALALVEQAIASAGPTADLLGLSGQLHLAAGNTQKGVELLRAALYLSPGQVVYRFHYAHGLSTLGSHRASRAQLLDVLQMLARMKSDEKLADGEITVQALRTAANERLRGLQ